MNRDFLKRTGRLLAPGSALVLLALGTACATGGERAGDADGTPTSIRTQSNQDASVDQRMKDLLKRADDQIDEQQFDAARRTLAEAQSLRPGDPAIARTVQDLQREEAEYHADQRAEQIDQKIDTGKEALDAGNFERARTLANEALAIDPASNDARKFAQRVETERDKAAAKAVETQVKGHLDQANAARKSGDYERAEAQVAAARQAAQGTQSFDRNIQRMADRVARDKSKAESRAVANEVARYLDMARQQTRADQFDAARESINRAYELDRENRNIERARNDLAKAEADYAAKAAERQAAQQLAEAERIAETGDTDRALAAYQAVLNTDPRNRDAQRAISRIERDKQRAIEEARKAEQQAEREAAKAREEAAKRAQAEAERIAKERAEAEAAAAKAREEAEKRAQAEAQRAERDRQRAEAAAEKEREEAAKRAQAEAERERQQAEAAANQQAREQAARAEAEAARAQEDAERERRAEQARQQAQAERERRAAEERARAATEDQEAQAREVAQAEMEARREQAAREAAERRAQREAERAPATTRDTTPRQADTRAQEERSDAEREVERRNAEAQRLLGQAERATEAGNFDAAAEFINQAEELGVMPREIRAARRNLDRARDNAASQVMAAQLDRAAKLAESGDLDAAVQAYDALLAEYPEMEAQITRARDSAIAAQAREAERAAEREARENQRRAEDAFRRGLRIYEDAGSDITLEQMESARARWLETLEIDPDFQQAIVYLQDTEAEFNALSAAAQRERNRAQREAEAAAKLDTPIVIDTIEPTPLAQFLLNLKLLTGVDFVLAGGIDARIEASFRDKPLREVLDSVLLPIGLQWERRAGEDTIIITPDLRTRVFRTTPDQIAVIDTMLDSGSLQRTLYPPAGEPAMSGQEIYTDPRQNIVVMTDSQMNIDKFSQLLVNLEDRDVGLVFKSYVIQQDKAPKVKALLDAILRIDDDAPYNPDRKLIIEGSELIIKDTPENIRRVEEILQDRQFLQQVYSNELDVATFNLTPVLEIEDNPELARQFGEQVRQIVESLLYSQSGREAASREGRRLWYHEETLQLTIVDFPDRLRRVEDFIDSLPQIERRRRSKIIFLNWQPSADLVSQIESFLGITGGGATTAGGGNEITKSLRVEGELEFRGAFFRVIRVNENDVLDDNDDSVELIVRTGTTSQEVTIDQFRSEFVEDFEIIAEDIRPSSTPGEGRAKLRIRYIPDETPGAAQQQQQEDDEDDDVAARREELGISIESIDNLNAVWIQYDNATDLQEIEFWIETLDIPTLQVLLEAKFVEVSESKARSLKSEFSVGDLTAGLTLSDSILSSRFANDVDEFLNPFESFPESTQSANLLKGQTVFNFIVNNGESPISLTLRALEAQGVINLVNAPSISVINGETATFDIRREFGLSQPTEGSTTGGGGDAEFTAVARLDVVQFEVSPVVTQAGNITLDPLDIELRDFNNNIGQITTLQQDADVITGGNRTAVTNTPGNFGVSVKEVNTVARIQDGGTIVLGGWRNERTDYSQSGVPYLQDIPFVGRILFAREQETSDKITMLIFLTGSVVRD